MPLKGRDTHADRPRNELEEEEETMQPLHYSQDQDQVHHSGTAARPGPNGDDVEFGSVEEDGDEDAGRPPTKRRRVPQQLSRQFTDEEEDTLIEFWSSTPMLYDRRHNDFKRNDKRRRLIDAKAKQYENGTGKFLPTVTHPRKLS